MKKIWIAILTAALLLTLVGCMRGGNADRGNDGILGDENDSTRSVVDDVKDGIDDAKDKIKEGIDDIVPGDNGRARSNSETVREDNRNDADGRIRSIDPDTRNGYWGNRDTNDSGITQNGGAGLNGSGVTGGLRNGGNVALPYGTIR